MEIYKLPTGDSVYRYAKSIVVCFSGQRRVLSTSLFNGGYSEKYKAIFNHDATQGAGMPCKVLADTYKEHMVIVATQLGLDPDCVTGVSTAASMENVAINTLKYEGFSVTAIVTGGIETNGGRVGDPAEYFKPIFKNRKEGTINIFLFFNCDMPAAIMARALVTCTEAKTAAIQELLAGSNYSTGLATGSGTDQTIIVADAEANMCMESAGKHSKAGELIGKVVMKTVKEALAKQTGLTPRSQHSILKRLKRFGVTEDSFWNAYKVKNQVNIINKPQFISLLEEVAQDDFGVTITSLYLHLLDQHTWQLLTDEETVYAANKLLDTLAQEYGVELVELQKAAVEDFTTKIIILIVQVVQKKINEVIKLDNLKEE
ncbi:MAG TPA: adenosylcobinamide amidohydrolase [Candidatus Avacidaminococcus intestinavium]|uniref:Adenosylcobinamide amidohydrolase n=1 Tax=Candidatus Avacidaminococcus intestinavium TaxID=2840684 RepID=A0A9D1MNJ9_9FIRM|nr:adenosylcobinamide amidohydrolase [Candidatus Avacidaminococcus intestinavium]